MVSSTVGSRHHDKAGNRRANSRVFLYVFTYSSKVSHQAVGNSPRFQAGLIEVGRHPLHHQPYRHRTTCGISVDKQDHLARGFQFTRSGRFSTSPGTHHDIRAGKSNCAPMSSARHRLLRSDSRDGAPSMIRARDLRRCRLTHPRFTNQAPDYSLLRRLKTCMARRISRPGQ